MIFAPGFDHRLRLPCRTGSAGHLVSDAPEVLRFQAQDHVGIGNIRSGDGGAGMAI